MLQQHSVLLRAALSVAAALFVIVLAPSSAAAAQNSFVDDDDTPHAAAVDALAAEGVVEGCGDDGERFCPGEPVQRDQLASFIVRALDLPASDEDFFHDDDGNAHEDNINALAAAGVTYGSDGGQFNPSHQVARDQMASLLVRSIELPSTDREFFTDISGPHAYPINKIAAAGVTAGCNGDQTSYCPDESVLRGQMATFLARATGLVEPVVIAEDEPEPEPEPTRAEEAVAFALSQRGKPYRWGGVGPGGYDCSGLTLKAWKEAGVSLPHNSRAQYRATNRVDRSDLRPGDLVFFGSPIHHVGMYIGDGKMVHSPSRGKDVHVTDIFGSSYYSRKYVGAGRVS